METVRRERLRHPETPGRLAIVERRLGAVALVAAVLVLLAPGGPSTVPPAEAGSVGTRDGGVTVINVPPQFSGFRISTQDGLNYIDVVVSDYNSWADIFRVEVRIETDKQASLADVVFQQYPDNVTRQRQPQFTETVGSFLVRQLSSTTYNAQPVTVPERTEMRITFVMSPVNGKFLSVTTTDLGGLTAFAQVEYSPGFLGHFPAVSSWILVAVAFVFSMILVTVRIRRDRRAE